MFCIIGVREITFHNNSAAILVAAGRKTFVEFEWNRSETIAMSKESCTQCQGKGLRERMNRKGQEAPCNCVLRGIFRACYRRFRQCAQKGNRMSTVRFEIIGGQNRRTVWGRKDEEYMADFCLVSRRYLDDFEYRIFRFHFLLGADWKLCCRQLKIEKGIFFHAVYRIQQKLGRAFRELKPYALFPLSDYFAPVVKREAAPGTPNNVLEMPPKKKAIVRPPLKKVA